MAATAYCTGAFKTETGRYYVTIQGIGQMEFQNLQELKDFGAAADDPSQTQLAAQFLVKCWLSQDPSGQSLSALEGKRLTLDLTAVPTVIFTQQIGVP